MRSSGEAFTKIIHRGEMRSTLEQRGREGPVQDAFNGRCLTETLQANHNEDPRVQALSTIWKGACLSFGFWPGSPAATLGGKDGSIEGSKSKKAERERQTGVAHAPNGPKWPVKVTSRARCLASRDGAG